MPATTSKKTTASTGPTLKALQTKLKSLQYSFDGICNFIETFEGVTTTTQLTVRLQQLEEMWESVNDSISEIEMHDDFTENEQSFKERADYGNRYIEAKTLLMEKLKDLEEPAVNLSTRGLDTTIQPTMDHVRLPQIKLQTFDGNIDEWLSFRDLYTSLIHWKTDLPDVEKLHYLKGCLEGEARALVDPLAITTKNYQVAWEILTKRYNDSKLLKRRQVQALSKLPSLVKESASELQSLLEGFERVLHTLDQLIQPQDYKDLLLIDILCSRLDPTTRRGWEEYSATKEQDKVKDLTEFLQRRVRVLGSLPSKVTETMAESKKRQPLARASHSAVQASHDRCVACSEEHLLYLCPTFQRWSISARDKLLRNHSLCRNCFRRGHQAADCTSRYLCRNCKAKHHTMVCFRSEKSPNAKGTTGKGSDRQRSGSQSPRSFNHTAQTSSPAEAVSSNVAAHRTTTMLLATAVVNVEDDQGVVYPARALLDSGSDCNFMTERMSQLLKVQRKRSDIEVLGIGDANTRVKHRVEAKVKSRVSGFSRRMEFLVLPTVTTSLPTTDVTKAGWKIPDGVELADPAFFESKTVDLVLGIEHFFDFFKTGNKIPLGSGLPTLTESVFGWVVAGTLTTRGSVPRISCNMAVSVDVEELLPRFWSCEEIGTTSCYSPEETRCEEHFERTVKRDATGRYTVTLPKNEDALARMGESRDIAFRRLLGLEQRLRREPELRQQYNLFMEEYLQMGHMRKVDATIDRGGKRCYLPHHPVVKEASTTTKVRVVFDASCKTSSGTSLNDSLMVGPVVQDDLRSIILRCRTRQIMVVADVEKMFRQINVDAKDMPLQSILWRVDPKEEPQTFELTTVTYGTKPAPFLATRIMKQLAMDEQARFPLAAKAMEKDVYMDDVLTGVDGVDEAVELRVQLDAVMESGGFRLRKWASNCPIVLQSIPEENLALTKVDVVNLDPDPAVKTLGLVWLPGTDLLKYQFQIAAVDPNDSLTKRKVLSIIASLFDPLGLVGAVITRAKIFMQQLWSLKDENGKSLDWDQPIPPRLSDEWLAFHEQLSRLNELRIPRCVVAAEAISVQLHFFSDASERAYGTCCYMKSVDSAGNVRVVLLTSKSKVAPLKSQSIPRLELCGALLAAQLCEKVLKSIEIENVEVFFWTDSTCVLLWLKAIPTVWVTFVANRVAKIQHLTEDRPWRHVPGVQNPADLISRGVAPEKIRGNVLWWEGPSWLKEEQESWPTQPEIAVKSEVEKETRQCTAHTAATTPEDFSTWYVSKFSSFGDLVRRTAYWVRLTNFLRRPIDSMPTEFLTIVELREAENILIRCVQKDAFKDEWKALSKKEAVARSSPLRWFNPQLSGDNLIRVGGRLGHSKETEDTKHPIVLPARHPFTRLLLESYHQKLFHAGTQLLLGAVRLKYWPLGGRSVARNVVHHCQRCFRAKPTKIQQFMGELPAARVTAARPFSRTGVDYFGPVYVRQGPRRVPVKAYVAVFVCMCTKAVHLELVTDLSTERFIQALRRFIARRGKCTDLYSDNGTNFVGARNRLQQLLDLLNSSEHHRKMSLVCAQEGIQWHFNPPGAPHFGGLWEAAVKSAKFHLLRVLGDNSLGFEDMETLLDQVEACLNSRPITAMSDDPNDLEPLTPGHFLIGASLQEIPDPDYSGIPMNRLSQFQSVQRNLQDFWKRWRTEYLAQLQGRSKRWQPPTPISIGKLVVLRDDNQPPIHWKMGRIQELHPGSDGVVRVVTVKTAGGPLKRPVEKICLLPPPCQPAEED